MTTENKSSWERRFYKECCFSTPGDSGPGGNTPADPDCYINVGPEEMIEFIHTIERAAVEGERQRILAALKENPYSFNNSEEETIAAMTYKKMLGRIRSLITNPTDE